MRQLLLLSAAILAGSSARAGEKYVTIKGQVKWNGDKAPAAVPVNFNGNKDAGECCKAVKMATLDSTEFLVDSKTLGLKNVVVFLRPDDTDKAKTFPLDQVKPELMKPKSVQHVIDQPKCQFEPRVLAARAGDTLVIKNSAAIAHNINYAGDPESINVLIPAGGEHKLKSPLDASRLPYSFKCDLHGWMTGRIRVFDHPYYAITDKDGKFEIADAPVGTWRIVYYHEAGVHQGKPEANEGHLGFPITIKGDKKVVELEPMKHVFQVKKNAE